MLVLALGAATGARAPHFLGALNLSATFLLAAVLALVSSGQLVALLGASIDLSVGPLMGLTVVILSFFRPARLRLRRVGHRWGDRCRGRASWSVPPIPF